MVTAARKSNAGNGTLFHRRKVAGDLEGQLGAEFDLTRTAAEASRKGLTGPAVTDIIDESEVDAVDIRDWTAPLRCVDDTECLAAKLEFDPLGDIESAEQRHVSVPVSGAADRVLAQVAEFGQATIFRARLCEARGGYQSTPGRVEVADGVLEPWLTRPDAMQDFDSARSKVVQRVVVERRVQHR